MREIVRMVVVLTLIGAASGLALSLVHRVTKERIEIKDKVYFKSGSSRILRKSFGLLNQVALTLKAHAEIKVLEIQGYTDDRGKAKKNRRISKKRARAVRSA